MVKQNLITKFWSDPLRVEANQSLLFFFKRSGQQQKILKTNVLKLSESDINLSYANLTQANIDKKEAAIRELEEKYLDRVPPNSVEKKVLDKWFITKKREVALLHAAHALAHKDESMKDFYNEACEGLYGKYDAELFKIYLHELLDRPFRNKEDIAKSVAKEIHLKDVIPRNPNLKNSIQPSPETFRFYRKMLRDMLVEVEEVADTYTKPNQKVIDSQTMLTMVSVLLERIGAAQEGWTAEIREYAHKISVNNQRKKVYLKSDEFQLNKNRLCGLLAHEVYIHVRRKMHDDTLHLITTESSPEDLAFEEGLGVLAEQLFLSKFYMLRQFRYIAIGLAIGVDGIPRNFYEVFNILWKLRYMSGSYSKKDAKSYAFDESIRCFRGIPLNLRGLAFTRDKIYTEGNIRIWQKLDKSILYKEAFSTFLLTGRHT